MRRWIIAATTLGLIAAPFAADARRAPAKSWSRALSTVARGARRLAKTRVADRTVTVAKGARYSVFVRPQRGVIGVSHPGGITGFAIGKSGKLSRHDAATMIRLSRRLSPAPTIKQIVSGLGKGARVQARRVDAEKRMDPMISSLLGQAKQATGEGVLWQGRKGAKLTYRPDAKVFVGATTFSRKGFFVNGKGELRTDSLRDLRSFLLEHK